MTGHDSAVVDFVERVLAREGALVERDRSEGLFVVLPRALGAALELPENVSLRVLGEPAEGQVGFPLESVGLQWCVERAASRGRLAAVRLPSRVCGVKSAPGALKWFSALNGTVRPAGSRIAELEMWVLEFRYVAHSEERAEGSVYVALEPASGAISLPLADSLLAALRHAEPDSTPDEPIDFAELARRAEPVARAEILRRLEPFQETRRVRLAADRERLVAYHATLGAEAARRRSSASDGGEEALRAKAAAIVRQRDAKLGELAERHSVQVRYALSSCLVARYEAPVCELVLRRRRREIPVDLVWDPHLHEWLPIACAGCGLPSLAFSACDTEGHLTCAACAARCPSCGRITCRVCHGPGCHVCRRREV